MGREVPIWEQDPRPQTKWVRRKKGESQETVYVVDRTFGGDVCVVFGRDKVRATWPLAEWQSWARNARQVSP